MTDEHNRTWNDQYMLRLPDGMRDRIKAAAAENNRSMNAEIVATLESAYPIPNDRAIIILQREIQSVKDGTATHSLPLELLEFTLREYERRAKKSK